MIEDQIALIKRELWEHRSLYLTPAVIALLLSLGTVTGVRQRFRLLVM